MLQTTIDVFIIGAGPIGLACGIRAKEAGLSYVIADKGCLVNSLYHYPVNMSFFSTSERLEIGGVPFVSIQPKPNRAEALEYYRRVAVSYDLKLCLFEAVQSISGARGNFSVQTSKGIYNARNIVIATGFYDIPVLLGVPGEDLAKVRHYYGDPHYYAFRKVLVVGANNSAVDAALETWRKGAEVTMLVREAEIGRRVKYWVRPDIVNRIEEGSIRAYFNASLVAVRAGEVDIRNSEGRTLTIPNDEVLAMTGYRPDFSFLQKAGIELSEDGMRPTYNPASMESNRQGIYLAGVVCGGLDTHSWFIENSRVHAEMIVEDIIEKLRVKN